MTAMGLAMHVVSLLLADVAVFASRFENLLRFIDVDMNLGFALGSGEQQRITEARQLFA